MAPSSGVSACDHVSIKHPIMLATANGQGIGAGPKAGRALRSPSVKRWLDKLMWSSSSKECKTDGSRGNEQENQDILRKAGRAAVTPSFKPVTGAFTSYGAGGQGGERTGDRTAWPEDALNKTSISTHKALIKKVAAKPRTERLPKTLNPWICKLWKWNYCNQYFNRASPSSFSTAQTETFIFRRPKLQWQSWQTYRHKNHTFSPYYGAVKEVTGEGNSTLLQFSCLENPMDGGA